MNDEQGRYDILANKKADTGTVRAETGTVKKEIDGAISDLLASLPDADALSQDDRRGIMARYTAILEGNFIYWMTATYLSVQSKIAHEIIEENLREEVRDNHPGMLRRFAVAANATSTDADRVAIHQSLQDVRGFVSGLDPLKMVLMMAFFEGFIARFMSYLADLAKRQGSTELEYTDVHGVVDIGHTEELFRAFEAEVAVTDGLPMSGNLLDGVEVLKILIETVIHLRPKTAAHVV